MKGKEKQLNYNYAFLFYDVNEKRVTVLMISVLKNGDFMYEKTVEL